MCHWHWHFNKKYFLAKFSASLKILEINCQEVLNKKITQPTKVSAGILLYCSQSECSLLHQAKVFSFAQKNLWPVQVVMYWISLAQFFLALWLPQGANYSPWLLSRNFHLRGLSRNFRCKEFWGQGICRQGNYSL